jgi:hypothetical protein
MSRDAPGELRLGVNFVCFKLFELRDQTFQHRSGVFGGVGILVAEPSPDLHQPTRLDYLCVNTHGRALSRGACPS